MPRRMLTVQRRNTTYTGIFSLLGRLLVVSVCSTISFRLRAAVCLLVQFQTFHSAHSSSSSTYVVQQFAPVKNTAI